MIVVCYLYNKNGMASWCIDAAKALHFNGQQVVLIKSKNIELPADFPVKYINFEGEGADLSNRSVFKKIVDKAFKYIQLLPFVKRNDGFLPALQQHLASEGIIVAHYLLNQTSLVNKRIKVPQHVVAWTYKPFLNDYLRKARLLAENFNSLQSNIYNALFWNKTDWGGYRNATRVLAVSNELKAMLVDSGITAHSVYPGTGETNVIIQADNVNFAANKVVKLAVMALSIDEKRKGLAPIIQKLKELKPYRFELTLIGGCSESFKTWVLEDGFPAVFTGLLSRAKAIDLLNGCDVLLFGSLVDDWGYVQVEAMSRSMAVLSPNASPYNEIVGRDDYLYDPTDDNDLENKLKRIVSADLNLIKQDKNWFKHRYDTLFSLKVFGENLINAITN